MKVLATYSIKGGVGKTSAAVNLATLAADRGWRVLLWDLDPQGAATYLFRVEARVKGGGKGLVRRKRSLLEAVRGSDVANLDLVPADFRYRHLDLLLDATGRPIRRLRQIIRPAEAHYDFVFLDCAPSVSLVTEGVLEVTDLLLIPVIPSTLSARTVEQLLAFIDQGGGTRSPELLAFFSMLDRRRKLHQAVCAGLPERHPGLFASARIPDAAVVERMGLERRALCRFAATTPAARAYAALWDEIQGRWVEP